MKQIIVTNFNNRRFVDLDQVQEIIQGMQTDIDVLEAQLHAEIVGKEQMVVTYESHIQEMLEVINFYADFGNWNEGAFYSNKMITFDCDESYYAGKYAREFLRKLEK